MDILIHDGGREYHDFLMFLIDDNKRQQLFSKIDIIRYSGGGVSAADIMDDEEQLMYIRFQKCVENLSRLFQEIYEAIKNILQPAFEYLKNVFNQLWKSLEKADFREYPKKDYKKMPYKMPLYKSPDLKRQKLYQYRRI